MADMNPAKNRSLLDEVIDKTVEQAAAQREPDSSVTDDFASQRTNVRVDLPQIEVIHGTDSGGRDLTNSQVTFFDDKIVLSHSGASTAEIVIEIAADRDDVQWIGQFVEKEKNSISPNISNRESNFRKLVDSALLHSALYRDKPSPAAAAQKVSKLVERHFKNPGSGKPRAMVSVSREGLPDLMKLAQLLSDVSTRALERGGTKPEFEEVLRKIEEQKTRVSQKTGEEVLGDALRQVSMPITPDMPATVSITGVDPYQTGSDGKPYVHFSMLVGIKNVGDRFKVEVTDAQGAAKREVKSLQDLTEEIVRRANDNPLDIQYWRFHSESFSKEPFSVKGI